MKKPESMVSRDFLERKDRVYDRSESLYREIMMDRLGTKPFSCRIKCLSPLRDEKHPSFSLYPSKNGIIMWMDHATGDSGDVIKLYSLYWHCTYNEALDRLDTNRPSVSKDSQRTVHVPVKLRKARLSATYAEWDGQTLAYWERYGISQATLIRYGVKPCLDGCVSGKKYMIASYPDNPLYSYSMNSSLKLYAPFAQHEHKWKSSCSTKDVFGLKQLRKVGKPQRLIVTKSLKDVMVLHEMGEYAIAPQSESTGLPEEVCAEINQRMGENPVYIFFDNDEAGKKWAEKMLDNNISWKNIVLPDGGPKDISDMVIAEGFEKARKWMKSTLETAQM